ncbi:MAG: hypothetical protein PW792_08895 [Acidobacteriaceae bacterium]|nr:hypothetical protein [Acidobacteriaceae bacterium]
MARLAMIFGVLLAILGVAYFVATGNAHKTALIPTWFGIVLIVCGVLANSENARQRMLWMHIGVTVSLLGFLFPAIRGISALVHAHSSGVALTATKAVAVQEELAMAALCFIFTALCVRSFIAARRERLV